MTLSSLWQSCHSQIIYSSLTNSHHLTVLLNPAGNSGKNPKRIGIGCPTNVNQNSHIVPVGTAARKMNGEAERNAVQNATLVATLCQQLQDSRPECSQHKVELQKIKEAMKQKESTTADLEANMKTMSQKILKNNESSTKDERTITHLNMTVKSLEQSLVIANELLALASQSCSLKSTFLPRQISECHYNFIQCSTLSLQTYSQNMQFIL
jgi:hypothetical protein